MRGFAPLVLIVFAISAKAHADETILTPIEVFGDRQEAQPGSYSVLDADKILNSASDHPAEILNTVPGVNIHTNSGQEHLVSIRSPVLTGGAGQGSFLILQNGVPTRAAAFGNVNSLLELHHEVGNGVEVVRGPGSAKYGSNAVHGLINVVLPDPSVFSGAKLHVSGSTLSRYKSDLELSNGTWGWAALSLQKDLGWRDFTGLQQQKASASARFEIGGWAATTSVSFTNLNQETAGFILGTKAYRDDAIARTNPNPEAYRDASSWRASVRFQREIAGAQFVLKPYVRSQEMEFRQHFLPYKGIEENGHDSFGLMSRVDIDHRDDLILRFGADVDFANGYLIETQPAPFGFFPGDNRFPVGKHYDYEVNTQTGALWAEAEWSPADDVTILMGLRGEAHDYDYHTNIAAGTFGRFQVTPDRSDKFVLLTPKLGIIWENAGGSDTAFYANYARGQRAPQASDLYRLQSLQMPGEIKTETLDSFEIGARGSLLNDSAHYDVAAYRMDKRNFFFRDADGLNVAGGKTDHMGIEASLDLDVLPEILTLHGSASWSEQTYDFDRPVSRAGESITSEDRIDSAPEWLADLAILWTPTDRLEAALSAEYIGKYFTNSDNSRTYPGHTVFNLRTSMQVTETLELYVNIRNLFDLNYADRADFAFGNDRYFPGEPLNATFGIRKTFGS